MKLEPIDAVSPSTYNPRSADAARLDLVALSLRKLGWLLPIYATPEGEILSGHQRHLVAGRLGLKMVPALRAALEHEFDLPYPDESRMGMVDAAKAAFGDRLGVRL
jgi:ParB-like chromosome segregation protein Spo0J